MAIPTKTETRDMLRGKIAQPQVIAWIETLEVSEKALAWLKEFQSQERDFKARAQIFYATETRIETMTRLLEAAAPKPATAMKADVVTPQMDLEQIAAQAAKHRDVIVQHEQGFEHSTLPERLCIGLACAKAHAIYALPADQRQGIGGRGKKTTAVSEGEALPATFADWLLRCCSWLNETTAFRYMKALKGLSLDHKATPEMVAMTLEALRASNEQAKLPAPSLTSLVKAAKALEMEGETEEPPPADDPEMRLGDAREALGKITGDWDSFVRKGQLDDLTRDDLLILDRQIIDMRDRIKARLKP